MSARECTWPRAVNTIVAAIAAASEHRAPHYVCNIMQSAYKRINISLE